jgi:hypothetical protein
MCRPNELVSGDRHGAAAFFIPCREKHDDECDSHGPNYPCKLTRSVFAVWWQLSLFHIILSNWKVSASLRGLRAISLPCAANDSLLALSKYIAMIRFARDPKYSDQA